MSPGIIATSEADPNCEGVQSVTYKSRGLKCQDYHYVDQLGVVPDMAFGPGWFWGWQSYFTVQTCISCFGYFGPRAAGLLPSSFRRFGPISCQINADLFAAPSLLIIQQLLLSHYTMWDH